MSSFFSSSQQQQQQQQEPQAPTASSRSRYCKVALRVAARVMALGTAALSGYAILQVRELLQDEAELDVDGGTLTMPVLLCMPMQVPGVNSTIGGTDKDDYACRSLRFMAQAAMCALGLAALAILLFVVIDALARTGRGPFSRSASTGMALFSCFILFQAAYSGGAIVQEVRLVQEHYEDWLVLAQQQPTEAAVNGTAPSTGWTVTTDNGQVVEITEIDMYGDPFILQLAVGALLLTCLLMLCEVVASLWCCGGTRDEAEDDKDDDVDDLQLKPTQTLDSHHSSTRDPFASPDRDVPSNNNIKNQSSSISTATTPQIDNTGSNHSNSVATQPPSWSTYGSGSLY